jgi:hypothetical protein
VQIHDTGRKYQTLEARPKTIADLPQLGKAASAFVERTAPMRRRVGNMRSTPVRSRSLG